MSLAYINTLNDIPWVCRWINIFLVSTSQVIEYPSYSNGRYIYRLERSEMCEYMINFIHKLKDLPEKYMMNSVLENFTILQVISNRETQETLLCIAFVFEVSVSDNGAQHHVYRLTKPSSNNHWSNGLIMIKLLNIFVSPSQFICIYSWIFFPF